MQLMKKKLLHSHFYGCLRNYKTIKYLREESWSWLLLQNIASLIKINLSFSLFLSLSFSSLLFLPSLLLPSIYLFFISN